MNHIISVVVPIYKAEKYIDRCVESILLQTFSDFELILVDDGSPDSCPQICDAWVQRDSRIRVLHKENGGPQDAVKHGIQLAEGAYITFVDSDDWLEKDFLKMLYAGITDNEADVAQCNYQNVYGEKVMVHRFAPQVLDEEKIKENLLAGMANDKMDIMSNSRCDKLYKTELVKRAVGLCDASIHMGEDFLLNFAVFGYCNKIAILDTPPLYNYYFNEASISSLYNPKHKYSKKVFYENLKKIAQIHNCYSGNIDFLRNRRYGRYIYECAISKWSRADKKKEIRDIIGLLDRKIWFSSIKTFDIPAERICVILTYFGMTDLMLFLVDVMKKIKGIE